MKVVRYSPNMRTAWDSFVEDAKNGTFLFLRAYMDYHSHRFSDHSLMFYDDKNRLTALLPANEDGSTLVSHGGLTYGGFILSCRSTIEQVLTLFDTTKAYLTDKGFTRLYYKQVPSCYHLHPSEEDDYALWRNNATLYVCNISSTVALGSAYSIPMERRRRRGIARAEAAGYGIITATAPDRFWPIMEANLRERYNATPVHTLNEMTMLMTRFPNNIRCFLAITNGVAEAGAIVYITRQTVHVQYAHASAKGKDEGALDFLYDYLIRLYKTEGYRYFDIGTSNEKGGQILNLGLAAQKEGFGGRAVAYKQWVVDINKQHNQHGNTLP